jgi:hypothetical protein
LTDLSRNSLFKRNIQFSCLIKAGGRIREFNFRRSTQTADEPFFVDVVNENGERCQFSMVCQEGQWGLVGAILPVWVVSAVKELHKAIVENQRA